MTLPLSESAHDSLIELLPWYVNGTLSGDEHRAVEEHLGSCAECREDVEALSRVSHAIRKDSPAPLVPPVRTEMLLDALDRPKHRPSGFPGWVSYVAAASVALVLAMTWVNLQNETTSGGAPTIFETATSVDTGEPISYVVEVTFEPGMSADSHDAGLNAISSVDGASQVGDSAYRIMLKPTPASLAELQQQIDTIEALPGIASARIVAVQLPVE